jgi:hypothetical protein
VKTNTRTKRIKAKPTKGRRPKGRKKEEAFWREEVEEKAREENTISNRRF